MIFTEDVEQIFGKRQWVSRTDEILAAQQIAEKNRNDAKGSSGSTEGDSHEAVIDVEATDVTPPASIPLFLKTRTGNQMVKIIRIAD